MTPIDVYHIWSWRRDRHRVTLDARTVLARLAATGFHVVAEGQAVVDGRVWQLVPGPGRVYRLRPPTDEAGA